MSKLFFTYGIFYLPEVIKALFDIVPPEFKAELHGYELYQGDKNDLTSEVYKIIKKEFDINTYSFLFLKQIKSSKSIITGKAYQINKQQEQLLDSYELCPQFYQKHQVLITDKKNKQHQAFIYTQNITGEKYTKVYNRMLNNIDQIIQNVTNYKNDFFT